MSSHQPTAQRLETLLTSAFRRSDEIFARIPREALLLRPISLRHPLLFYLGHLPAFAWNQVGRGVLGEGHLHRDLDVLFERGIDPADEEGARAASVASWPPVDEVLAYRDEARRAVLARIPAVLAREDDPLCARGRLLHLIIEHERMHHETLMYLLQELPPGALTRPAGASFALDDAADDARGDRGAEPRHIPAGVAVIGADFDAIEFGWDNEFGRVEAHVPAFTLDPLPVRNRDYLDFLNAQPEGARAALWPRAWTRGPRGPEVKTVLGPAPFELAASWPAQVSGAQARAYAAFHGGRLPTEAELCRAAFGTPDGDLRAHPWGDAPPEPRHGNFGFRRWCPVPVGSHPDGASAWGVEELVGNGWEWTSTPFAPLPGFTPYARTYPGYSTDFFDDEHDIVFGASWATDEVFLRPSFRNWYRRDYPYVFSSFRLARGGEAG